MLVLWKFENVICMEIAFSFWYNHFEYVSLTLTVHHEIHDIWQYYLFTFTLSNILAVMPVPRLLNMHVYVAGDLTKWILTVPFYALYGIRIDRVIYDWQHHPQESHLPLSAIHLKVWKGRKIHFQMRVLCLMNKVANQVQCLQQMLLRFWKLLEFTLCGWMVYYLPEPGLSFVSLSLSLSVSKICFNWHCGILAFLKNIIHKFIGKFQFMKCENTCLIRKWNSSSLFLSIYKKL